MAICSFYIKTNIVIPTCMSGDLPPFLPSSQCVVIDELMGEGLVQCCLVRDSRTTNRWDRQLGIITLDLG